MRPRTYQKLFFVGRFPRCACETISRLVVEDFCHGRLPIHRRAFVVLICLAILALSGWREWSTREAELNAEVDSRSRSRNTRTTLGGEEFVLLLPDAGAAGCQQVGKRVRESLAALGIVHDSNLPSRQVTVSIGGAAADCRGNQAPCQSLIAAADRALYSAKENGRNRLVMSGQIMDWARGRTA